MFLLLLMIQDFRVVLVSFQRSVSAGLVAVFSALNIARWRELLQQYTDNVICEFLEFGWPTGYMSDTLPIFHLRTHRGVLTIPD